MPVFWAKQFVEMPGDVDIMATKRKTKERNNQITRFVSNAADMQSDSENTKCEQNLKKRHPLNTHCWKTGHYFDLDNAATLARKTPWGA